MRRAKLAFVVVLLFLTSLRCSTKDAYRTASEKAGGAGAVASSDETAARGAFVARGIDAPRTVASARKEEAPLDLAQLSEAIGEAQEVTPEALKSIESRNARAQEEQKQRLAETARVLGGADSQSAPREEPPPVLAAPAELEARIQSAEGGERESDERGRRVPKRRPVADPAKPDVARDPMPREPAAAAPAEVPADEFVAAPEPKVEAQKEPPRTAERLLEQGDLEAAKALKKSEELAKEKDKKGKSDGDDEPRPTVLPPITRAPSAGKILVRGESGKLEAIKPRAVRVLSYVEGPRARTVVDYVFENPHKARLEGTFYHALPADASPAGFAMFDGTKRVDGESMFQSLDLLPDLGVQMIDPHALDETAPRSSGRTKGGRAMDWGTRKDARVVEQKRAREVYEDIVRSEVDPALLEWSGGSNFQARVFPLEAESLKRIVIAYEQPLVFDGTSFRYSFALPSEPTIRQREAVLFVDTRQGEIRDRPDVEEKKLGRWSRFNVAKPAAGAILSVSVAPKSPNVVLRGRDRAGLPGEAFYAEVRPSLVRGEEMSTGRALLLVDTSLSSDEDGAHARRAKLIEALLRRDNTIRQYAVALFDLRTRWLHRIGWRDNTEENRRETAEDLRRVYLEGATSFAAVLAELEKQRSWAVDGEKTTVFLFSDGEITWGLDRVEALASKYPVLRDVRWITYRFGELPVNRNLFDHLSSETRGRTVSVLSEAEVDDAAVAHRAAPVVLESVKVKGARAVDLVVAGDPKLIFPGQTLSIAGRLPEGGDGVLTLSIRAGEAVSAIDVPLGTPGADDMFAPRAWADLHTKKLIALDDVRLDRMVVALSQHYRLANARASFLVLDREEQARDYNLKDENVDLANLEELRRREEDQRRDKLLGIAVDEVPKEGRELIELLSRRTDGLAPFLKPQPLLEAPFAGGDERLDAEATYRKARAEEKLDFQMYDRIARARALAGDTAGAVRALSSAVEVSPRDGEAMRLVGYALLALAQYDVASELFERLRLIRPFEPEVFLEEALALDASGRYAEAARNFEILLARSWRRHENESRVTAAFHYARLLIAVRDAGVLRGGEGALVAQRLSSLLAYGVPSGGSAPSTNGSGAIDLQLTTFWSTDSIDIDLWVYEPNGEKCFYSHRDTTLGGKLFWDVTDGLGPELYHAVRAHPGQYDTLVHFYGSRAPRLRAPTAMLMVVDRDLFTKRGAGQRRFQMRMLPQKDAVLMMRTDVFEAR